MDRMQKVILLGAGGQLGRQWQVYLQEQQAGAVRLFPYTSAQLDITRPEELRREISDRQPAVIINCAAFTAVDEAEEKREAAHAVNAGAVRTLAGICRQHDIRLVHFSTDYVFPGRKKDRERYPDGYPEDHPADPVNWYGATKWEGEEAIRHSGCRALIVRVSWLCGAFGHNFVKSMLDLSERHERLRIVDDQCGSPTFADNLVANTWRLLRQRLEGTYHISSGGIISWADYAGYIFERAGCGVDVERIPSAEYPTRAARPFYSKLSTQKARQVEGIVIENWKTGLDRLLETLL